jgi:uncharacterized membrane protein YhaH (DUF805 family)
MTFPNVFSWRGRVGRAYYLGIGFTLMALKHNLDRLTASFYGYEWKIFNYWVFPSPDGIATISVREAAFYGTLLVFSLPFIWIGTCLTLQRLRDVQWPLWMVLLFFAPFINLFFFVILTAIPAAPTASGLTSSPASPVKRFVPRGQFGSAFLGVVSTALLAVIVVTISASGLGNYGWGVFVGIPFFLGLNSVLIYGFHEERSIGKCLLVATLSTALAGLSLFAFAIEGVICLIMALPLALVLSLFGALIGYALLQNRHYNTQNLRVVSAVILAMHALTLFDYAIGKTPAMNSVTTSVVINARPETVWTNVISFSELPQPTEAIFKTGIAYPVRAEISGKGPGAVRHCVFSTGPFVEPITVWDEPRLLQFDVTTQPRSMDELSIYKHVSPPHLENYFISKKGQFALKQLPDGTTLLEGTTWYENRYWPAPYWSLWSDQVIHQIHGRVLSHIKSLSEKSEPGTGAGGTQQ